MTATTSAMRVTNEMVEAFYGVVQQDPAWLSFGALRPELLQDALEAALTAPAQAQEEATENWSKYVDRLLEIGAKLGKRIEFLEGLFDFSDPEIVLHSGPNDPVTKDAVVVLRSYYEQRRTAPAQADIHATTDTGRTLGSISTPMMQADIHATTDAELREILAEEMNRTREPDQKRITADMFLHSAYKPYLAAMRRVAHSHSPPRDKEQPK